MVVVLVREGEQTGVPEEKNPTIVVGQNLALHAVSAYTVSAYLVSAFPAH